MKIVGIICEYNPLHRGHLKQIRHVRDLLGADTAVVCLMSGNFVQRGMPAVYPKMVRAEAALRCGADLVLELPLNYALSSAEGFAAGGVSILGAFCDWLCFGAESATEDCLMQTAELLLSPEFSRHLRAFLDTGLSFPAARAETLRELGKNCAILSSPNDLLGVEYCKGILSQNSRMKPLVIRREGGYHDLTPDPENPSATSLRQLISENRPLDDYIPSEVSALYRSAPVHTLQAGERAILGRLRTMTDAEFEALPYGSEGLWRKLMHESRRQDTLEHILTAVKSKRYTRTRLDRMVMCAFLGLTREELSAPAPYARILGFSARGQQVLRMAKQRTTLYNIGQKTDDPFFRTEVRCSDLYGLFRQDTPDTCGVEQKLRILNPSQIMNFS